MMRRRLIPTIGGEPARDRAAFRRLGGGAIIILVALQLAHLTPETSYADDGLIARGSYLVHAAGCVSCHTDKKAKGAAFAGGRGLKTPFGTYYSPNITPDPETGIGTWSDREAWADAMRVQPDFNLESYLPSLAKLFADEAQFKIVRRAILLASNAETPASQ